MITSADVEMSGTPLEEALLKVCRDLVVPLVQADGGELHFVSFAEGELALHLSGACAGCPGTSLTSRGVIEPALRAIAPELRLRVTAGASIPFGARKLGNGA